MCHHSKNLQKKTNERLQEKLQTDGGTEGWTERQESSHDTFLFKYIDEYTI